MSRFWSQVVHTLTPYVPGEQPRLENLVKLNTNENPYGPSPRALEAIREAATDSLRLYPDPTSARLRQVIAARHGLDARQVFVGNGSDEVLALAFLALLKHDRPLLFPDITYSFYPVYCALYGIDHEQVPLDGEYRIRVDDYRRPNGGIIFPNPNAPTGRWLDLDELRTLLAANPESPVVVDEAYVDFGCDSAVTLIQEHPNLLVIHTLSKGRSLAGLRLGFAMGHPGLIEALVRVKDSFNSYPVDRLAMAGAIAALEDVPWFERTRQAVMRSREALTASLGALGFEVLPSAANFIFARHPRWAGADLTAKLRERAIIVRHFNLPRIDAFLRISIGTDEQCGVLVDALREIVGKGQTT
ncbi:histidinol-phosphate transaminase [Geothrix sp. 21YS21S-2]|uniref:histidinol-phosphate transaminase n=1 Tax=Geothrix sp. 21YS21S-2 TaxID=3068893 RepID=UPI0027B9B25E|nr:histidinol-phosphate transaminase [Geothrix sp. 21YS21S-2]